jgi:hypothetical protein
MKNSEVTTHQNTILDHLTWGAIRLYRARNLGRGNTPNEASKATDFMIETGKGRSGIAAYLEFSSQSQRRLDVRTNKQPSDSYIGRAIFGLGLVSVAVIGLPSRDGDEDPWA